jgi:hypothetical protein
MDNILPVRLSYAFSEIARPLYNPWDESDDKFKPFHCGFDSTLAVTPDNLRKYLVVANRYSIDIVSVDWKELIDNASSTADGAATWRALQQAMTSTLITIVLVRARAKGVVRVRTWLIGELEDQDALVGLRTMSTET